MRRDKAGGRVGSAKDRIKSLLKNLHVYVKGRCHREFKMVVRQVFFCHAT